MGGIEFGRFLWTKSALDYSVQEAARYGVFIASPACSASAVQSYAAAATPQLNFPASTFTVTSEDCGCQVSASYNFQFVATGLFPMSPTLSALACFPS
jgi:hypothetical protein